MRLPAASLALLLAACGGAPVCDPASPGTICTIAGTGEAGLGVDGVPALQAALYTPQDLAIGPDGALWFLDFNNYMVREIDLGEDRQGIIHTIAGTGLLGDSPDGVAACPAADAMFNHTPSMAFHDGYLYLAAWHNSRIKRIRLADRMLENYAGIGKRTIYTGDDGPALEAALDLPSSITFDPDGNAVVMDQANQVIRKIDAAGVIHRYAGVCVVEWLDASLERCTLQAEAPVACPGSGKRSACVERGLTGARRHEALMRACQQPCTPGYGGDGGDRLSMRMGQPFGQAADPAGRIAYDAAGNLYFADTGNNRIRKIDPAGVVTTVVGTGEEGYGGDGGPAAEAQINHPVDLAFADDGTLYFTDTENNCIRKVDPTGIVSTVAGQCDTAGQCGAGASTGNCFQETGASCSMAGTGLCFSGDGGPPAAARLNRPYGIELSGKKLYVADSFNNRIRVVNLP